MQVLMGYPSKIFRSNLNIGRRLPQPFEKAPATIYQDRQTVGDIINLSSHQLHNKNSTLNLFRLAFKLRGWLLEAFRD